MLNNNHNHKSCAAAEQMVSYLYGETTPTEKAEFAAHLQSCSACADEFANFGLVRSSVQEWRNEEFLNIETPSFEIQTNHQDKEFVSSSYQIWLAKLRHVFTFNPALAAAAFAVLIVCIGFGLFALNFSRTDEVAEKTAGKNSIKANVSPTVEEIIQPLKENTADKVSEKSPSEQTPTPFVSEPKDSQPQIAREKRTAVNDSAIKISGNIPKNNADNAESYRTVKTANKVNKKLPTVQKPRVPIFSTPEDDEDKSVRLADLFDEIDAK